MKRSDAEVIGQSKRNLSRRLSRSGKLRLSNYCPDYEISARVRGTSHGGVAAMLELARGTGLCEMIDASVSVLKERRPYAESDHMMAIAAAVLAGGSCPEDLRRLRQDGQFLSSLGLRRLPDSTTCGDFLARLEEGDIQNLIEAVLATSQNVLGARLSARERQVGHIDADGTIAPTGAECMEGIEWNGHKRQWGYAPLLISLANTGQPLAIVNRSGNATSSKDAAQWLDMAAESMLKVFERLMLRGDTDFSQTKRLDRWHESGRIDFVLGYDACPSLVARADALPEGAWSQLTRPARYEVKTQPRTRPERIKDALIAGKGWRTLRTVREDIAQFDYKPVACQRPYRMIVLRKRIEVTQGQMELEPVTRYFFYITNLTDDVPAREIVRQANLRCNQENLIAQLKTHAIRTTGATLLANWAWMMIASLAWTLKSWFALMADAPAERRRLLGMELRTFVNLFMTLPVQVVRAARWTMLRVLGGHLPSLPLFLRIWADIRLLRRLRI